MYTIPYTSYFNNLKIKETILYTIFEKNIKPYISYFKKLKMIFEMNIINLNIAFNIVVVITKKPIEKYLKNK